MPRTYVKCKGCGCPIVSESATFCGSDCQREFMRRHAAEAAQRRRRDAASEASAVTLLALHARLDRCSTHWERAAVELEIDRVTRGFASVTSHGKG